MTPADLDAIRITAASIGPTATRVEADVAAAYTASAGLTRFRRTFTFTAPDSFSIEDQIETRDARAVQWYLHADQAIEKAGDRFVIPGRRPLTIGIRGPITGARIEPTTLTAPGQPGSITTGPQERRGVQLVLETPSGTSTRIAVDLRLEK
jgi:hypothetical protein